MKTEIKKYGLYVAMFVFWAVVFVQIPLIQDSWAGQIYNGFENFIQWTRGISQLYFTTNGRIISFIVVGFFERNEIMLDISNAIFMTVLVFLFSKILKNKSNILLALIWGLLLLVSSGIRIEVYFYATMIYLLPLVLLMAFIWFANEYKNINQISEGLKFIILCLLGVLNSGWIEHSGFAFVFIIGVCWLIDLIKNRKFNLKFTIFEFINGITFLLMMFSPGLRIHRQVSPGGAFAETLISNVGYAIQALVYDHKLIFVILILASMTLMHQKVKKKKNIYYAYQIVLGLFLALFLINCVSEALGIVLPEFIILNSRIYFTYGLMWSVAGIILIVALFIPLLFCDRKNILIFSYFVGMFSVAPIVVTPNFSYRVCFFAFVIIVFVTAGIISEIDFEIKQIKSVLYVLTSVILFIQVDSYSISVANIVAIQNEREELIQLAKEEQQLRTWDYEKTLILPTFSANQLYAQASPQQFYDPIHYQVFLRFYGLDDRTLVVFSDVKNELRVVIEEGIVTYQIIPERGEYQYVYYIMNAGQVVSSTEVTSDTEVQLEMPTESGSYYFVCDMIDQNGNVVPVHSAKVQTVN